MRYFVSIEKTPYFYWQIELLIESFKNLGLEKKILIAIADSDKGGKFVPKNIAECEFFLHENFSKNFNYKYINKYLSLDLARRTRRIRPPFCVIEPDMICLKPLEIQKSDNVDIVVSNLESNNFNNFNNFKINFDEKKWTQTGSTFVVFKDSPIMYNEIANKCNELLNKNKDLIQTNWKILDKIVCNLIFDRYFLKTKTQDDLECGLHEEKDAYFLHYNSRYDFFYKMDFESQKDPILDISPYNKMLTINPSYSKNIAILKENINNLLNKTEVPNEN